MLKEGVDNMNNLKIGNIVNLEENKEYIIAATAKKNNFNYLYLITSEEPYKVKFAKVIIKGNEIDLEIVCENKEKEELLKLFQQELKNIEI